MIRRPFAVATAVATLLWTLPGLLLPAPAAAFSSTQAVAFPRSPLTVETESGAHHEFIVEVARSPAQRSRGLMFRNQLASNRGMLFVYAAPQVARMWMKDTPIPLDMLFISANGRVLEVVERTEPLSLQTVASTAPVLGVLELRGGRCAELGIAPGDRVLHSAFVSDPAP